MYNPHGYLVSHHNSHASDVRECVLAIQTLNLVCQSARARACRRKQRLGPIVPCALVRSDTSRSGTGDSDDDSHGQVNGLSRGPGAWAATQPDDSAALVINAASDLLIVQNSDKKWFDALPTYTSFTQRDAILFLGVPVEARSIFQADSARARAEATDCPHWSLDRFLGLDLWWTSKLCNASPLAEPLRVAYAIVDPAALAEDQERPRPPGEWDAGYYCGQNCTVDLSPLQRAGRFPVRAADFWADYEGRLPRMGEGHRESPRVFRFAHGGGGREYFEVGVDRLKRLGGLEPLVAVLQLVQVAWEYHWNEVPRWAMGYPNARPSFRVMSWREVGG